MPRARDLGVPFPGDPGPLNAITDVAGVCVGHTTLIQGAHVRTGVTAILPRGPVHAPVFAGYHSLNGNGEMTGTLWIEESGFLEGPLLITNTHSVGVVRDAVIAWTVERKLYHPLQGDVFWSLPVVAETYDGTLNEINGFHVQPAHVFAALDNAATGPVAEGNVGGGTGMICHGFKGGIGTASRRLTGAEGGYTVGVLVQANYGARRHLTIAGVPVGQEIPDLLPEVHAGPPPLGAGSIIGVVATDAPLLPHQLKRIAQRVGLGIARLGGMGANTSGDIFLAFSTANPGGWQRAEVAQVDLLPNDRITPFFEATVFAAEEAIVNALVAARTLTGRNGNTVHALPHDRLQAALEKYNRR
ncbi:MAG: S58 family peptidase [Chloroflexi bacterium]|nr:MAG: S58 family peptidase [Chloroflexota bacterium]